MNLEYSSMFSRKWGLLVLVILQTFFTTRDVLKIGENSQMFASFSWENSRSRDLFRPITRERKYLIDFKVRYTYYLRLLRV